MRAIKAWFSSIKRFLASTYRELQRIQWPTRAQTIRLTLIVIGACIVIGAFLLGIDYLLAQGLKWLLEIS